MAELDLGKLSIKIEVDNKEANEGLDDTSEKVEKVEKKGGGSLKKFGKTAAVGLAAIGTAAVASGKALWDMTKNASDGVGDLDDMAQRIGFSTQALQEWGYVAKMNGMELDVLQTGMKTFTTAMDGSSAAGVAACKKLGISIEGLSNEEAFNIAITALQGVTDETEKMALATDLFGAKAAQKMMPMLKQTAADTEALKQKANELGLVYSEDMVAAATTFGDTWDTLGMVF